MKNKVLGNLGEAFGTVLWTMVKILGFTAAAALFIPNEIVSEPGVAFSLMFIMTVLVLYLDYISWIEENQRKAAELSECLKALNLYRMMGGNKLNRDVQEYVDRELAQLAKDVKRASDNLIILQKGGFEALTKRGVRVPEFETDDDGRMETKRNEIRSNLKREFDLDQEAFYRAYDDFLKTTKHYGSFHFKERSWKAYLDEEGVEKSA